MRFTLRCVPVGPLGANCYLLYREERDDCVVIDPGAEAARIRAALAGRKVAAILLTHGHFDHIGAVDALMEQDTALVIHEADAPMLRDPSLNACDLLGEVITCREATRLVHEGDVLDYAGLTITVLHTPGHTPGGVCYQCGEHLFTGDTLFAQGYGRYDLPGGSWAALRKSLRRLEELRQTLTIHGGHGG